MQDTDEKVKGKHELWARFTGFKKSDIAFLSHQLIRESDQEEIENLRLDLIAQKMHISPSYISRCFKNFYNSNPNQSITQRKMTAAKKLLLKNPRLTMDEVAEKIGYNSGNYFIKVFKKTCKITPYQYRKQTIRERKEFSAARAAIRKVAKISKVRISNVALYVCQHFYLYIRNRGIKRYDIRFSLSTEDDRLFIEISAPGENEPYHYKIAADGEDDF